MTGEELAGILERSKTALRLTLSSGSVVDIESPEHATIHGSVLRIEGGFRNVVGIVKRPKVVSIDHIALIETVDRRQK